MKNLLAIVLSLTLLLALFGCTTANSQIDLPSAATISESSAASLAPKTEISEMTPELNWGEHTDTLKKFADHGGRQNQYKDYAISVWAERNGKKTKAYKLEFLDLGSDFLTEIQEMPILSERPIPPNDEIKMTLSVTDAGVTYLYYFFEKGRVYTEQNDKLYCLDNSRSFPNLYVPAGTNTSYFQTNAGVFVGAAYKELSDEKTGAPTLPKDAPPFKMNADHPLDPQPNDSKHKTDFKAENYDVVIIESDYGNLSPAIPVTDKTAKARILEYLNQTNKKETQEITSGGGTIIRVFNKDELYDYKIVAEQIIDYQSEQIYACPDGLFKLTKSQVLNEIITILEGLAAI